jgi:acetyl esterase/lipase
MTDTATPETPRAARKAGRPARILRGLLRASAWTVAVLVLLMAIAFFGAPLPLGPLEDTASVIAMLVPWTTGLLLAFTAILAAAAVLARRRRTLATVAGIAGLAALGMIATPWAATAREADVNWSAYFAAAPAPQPDATETYASIDGHDLNVDVYLPETAEPVPAVVYVHGGGWSGGSRSESAPWQQWLSDQGYAVFSIDYRLAPTPRWEDAVGDVKCALGWVRANAAEYGVDAANVSIAGDSAGGHLSMMAAYTVGDPALAPSCAVDEAPVASVMSWFAPTDLASLEADSDMPDSARGYLTEFLGAGLAEEPSRYEAASPLTYARPGLPPTMIVQGGADRLVPLEQGEALAAALEQEGVPVATLDLPWAHHGFTGQWGSWASQALRPAVVDFLAEHAH